MLIKRCNLQQPEPEVQKDGGLFFVIGYAAKLPSPPLLAPPMHPEIAKSANNRGDVNWGGGSNKKGVFTPNCCI